MLLLESRNKIQSYTRNYAAVNKTWYPTSLSLWISCLNTYNKLNYRLAYEREFCCMSTLSWNRFLFVADATKNSRLRDWNIWPIICGDYLLSIQKSCIVSMNSHVKAYIPDKTHNLLLYIENSWKSNTISNSNSKRQASIHSIVWHLYFTKTTVWYMTLSNE